MFPSPSLAGWGRWRPRGIQRTSRATLCKQQQRFPHAQVPPHPASCTGPAIPASLHTLQGSSLQGSICSGCTENPAPHLQQLCEEGLSHPPLQLHRAALKLHLRVVNPASRKAVLFSLFFFFFSHQAFSRESFRARRGRKKNCTANPCCRPSPAPAREEKQPLVPPDIPPSSQRSPPGPEEPPLCSGCSNLRAARV